MNLAIVPCDLDDANEFVRQHHRHWPPVTGHKFSVAVTDGYEIHGVAIVGRPSARFLDDGWTLEVTRNCTDGTKNAPSMLYGAACRASFAMGYRRVVTYTGKQEPGTSLRAAGFKVVGEVTGRQWDCQSRPRVLRAQLQDKLRWEREA
jgi:hypothetical protein